MCDMYIQQLDNCTAYILSTLCCLHDQVDHVTNSTLLVVACVLCRYPGSGLVTIGLRKYKLKWAFWA